MSYTVVQQTLDLPSAEQVKRAFGSVEGLTKMDAEALSKQPFGILAKFDEESMAEALKDALIKEGVPAEVVDEANLPELPQPYHLNRLDFSPDALLITDTIGRIKEVPWTDVLIVAAGKVNMREFVEIRRQWANSIGEKEFKFLQTMDSRLAFTDRHYVPRGRGYWKLRPVDITSREEEHDRHLLEIILAGGKLRYSINADKAPFLFSFLGERRTKNLSEDFLMLVRDLIPNVPHAALNRGAFAAQENAIEPFTYPGKTAFYHEIVWLLWHAMRERA
ncbi:MAG TPA: hypothetical protein VFB72_16405 [Verrucomicrobiae bacterium]|nr:hypothetical protein [Verrucomicrobiae bacterium]